MVWLQIMPDLLASLSFEILAFVLDDLSAFNKLSTHTKVTCREAKCKKSQAYAAEVGLPVLKHVLLPKARGFCACLQTLRGSLDAGSFLQIPNSLLLLLLCDMEEIFFFVLVENMVAAQWLLHHIAID